MITSHSNNIFAGIRDKLFAPCFEPTGRDTEILSAVTDVFDSLSDASVDELTARVRELREQVVSGASITDDTIMIPALALAKQSLIRTVRMTAYDVQILAGIAMCRGAICEMQTGEGKTLASVFPIVTHALTGKGVHVATVNAYLAERDFELIGPALRLLGLTAGISRDGASVADKRAAYECDVTFATGYEFGFDYLRDQISTMSRGPDKLGSRLRNDLIAPTRSIEGQECQRGYAMAIIDEADSVLIDEAITPLVLSSGGTQTATEEAIYHAARWVAAKLDIASDFFIDNKTNSLFLTERGSRNAHSLQVALMQRQDESGPPVTEIASNCKTGKTERFGSGKCKEDDHIRTSFDMMDDIDRAQSWAQLPVRWMLKRPWKTYVEAALRAQHIIIRDVNYVVRDGKVSIVDEYTGRIFNDRHWRDGLHQAVEAKEGVVITDERRTLARISRQRYFQRYDMLSGMTGTASGHQRELLSCYGMHIVVIPLRKRSQRNELSPRYFSSEELKIEAVLKDVKERCRVGQPVLIGTRTIEQSIRLSQLLGEEGIAHRVLNGVQDAEEASLIATAGKKDSVTVATNMAGRGTDIKPTAQALEAGGLHVIGFERNFSRRIDRQLLGRAGRQGDPGSGQFFVSADDEIIQRYSAGLTNVLQQLGRGAEGQSNTRFDQWVRKIQNQVERETCRTRRLVMREELWLDEVKKTLN